MLHEICFSEILVLYFLFCWSIMVLLCCVNFQRAAKWSSYIHTFFFMFFFSRYSLSQDIEYSSLCYRVESCVSILCIIDCTCWSQTSTPFLPRLPSPLATTTPTSVSLSLFPRWVHLCRILDSRYKWCHTVFGFLCLTSHSVIISRSTHVVVIGTV